VFEIQIVYFGVLWKPDLKLTLLVVEYSRLREKRLMLQQQLADFQGLGPVLQFPFRAGACLPHPQAAACHC